jgi:hypothetical protein
VLNIWSLAGSISITWELASASTATPQMYQGSETMMEGPCEVCVTGTPGDCDVCSCLRPWALPVEAAPSANVMQRLYLKEHMGFGVPRCAWVFIIYYFHDLGLSLICVKVFSSKLGWEKTFCAKIYGNHALVDIMLMIIVLRISNSIQKGAVYWMLGMLGKDII